MESEWSEQKCKIYEVVGVCQGEKKNEMSKWKVWRIDSAVLLMVIISLNVALGLLSLTLLFLLFFDVYMASFIYCEKVFAEEPMKILK